VARRTARGDIRVDGVLLAVALLIAVIALALPDARSTAVASAIRHYGIAPLVRVNQRAEMARRALAVHDSAALAADSVALRAYQAGSLEAENRRLRELLSLGERLQWGFVPAEAIHTASSGEPHTMLLSRGARDGIAPFQAVITAQGIVGSVMSVDATTSVVQMWPHPDFRVSAMSADGDAAGIVGAHLAQEEGARFLLEFRGVPFRVTLDSGDVIVSSGAGGVFPRGVPIGVIVRETETAEGWSRTYLMRPIVHPADVGPVIVLSATRARVGVESAFTPTPPPAGVTTAEPPPPDGGGDLR
jgi:rod shape-determining protein MreC